MDTESSSTNSEPTSTNVCNPVGFKSRPTCETPKLELTDNQTVESGYGEGPSFSAAEQVAGGHIHEQAVGEHTHEQAAGGHTETTEGSANFIHVNVPGTEDMLYIRHTHSGSTTTTTHATSAYEENNPEDMFIRHTHSGSTTTTTYATGAYEENNPPVSEALSDVGSTCLLQQQVHKMVIATAALAEQGAGLRNIECQENERIIRKVEDAGKNNEIILESTKYLRSKNKQLDTKLYESEQQMKAFKQKNEKLAVVNEHQKKTIEQGLGTLWNPNDEVDVDRQEKEELLQKLELQEKKIRSLEEEKLKYKADKGEQKLELEKRMLQEEKAMFKLEQQEQTMSILKEKTKHDAEKVDFQKQKIEALQEQKARLEAKLELQEQKMQELKEQTTQQDVDIMNTKDELNNIVRKLFQLVDADLDQKLNHYRLHVHMESVSQTYASYSSEQSKLLIEALDLPYSNTIHSAASESKKQHKGPETRESASMPIGADASDSTYQKVGGAGLTESLGNSMLDTEIKDEDLIHLAAYFDSATLLAAAIQLHPHEEGDVKRAESSEGTQVAVRLCLKYWKKKKSKQATFQALLTIVRSVGKEDTATNIFQYFKKKYCNVRPCDS